MEKVQLNVRVSADIHAITEAICAANKWTQAEAVEAALRAYVTPEDGEREGVVALGQRVETLLQEIQGMRRELGQRVVILERAAQLVLEFFGVTHR